MRSISAHGHRRARRFEAALLFLAVSFGCGDGAKSMPAGTDATGVAAGSSSTGDSGADDTSSGPGNSGTSVDGRSDGTSEGPAFEEPREQAPAEEVGVGDAAAVLPWSRRGSGVQLHA